MKRRSIIIAVALSAILLLSTLLRLHQYSVWPRHGATFDEFAWVWLGMSTLTQGIPQSWSFHPQYADRKQVKIQGADFVLVKPYLEHPPFFGIVAGAFALAAGERRFEDVNLGVIRVLSVVLGVMSVAGVFYLGYLLYGVGVGLLASLIYGIMPTVVIGSRLVQNENFFVPLWLGMLILLVLNLRKRSTAKLMSIGLIGGLLILSKIPWIAGILSAFAVLWYKGRRKDSLLVLVIALCVGAVYIVYGMLLDRDVFIGLMGLQLNRYDISFSGIYSVWLKPLLVDRYYLDGWVYAGWIAFFVMVVSAWKRHYLLALSMLAYGLVYILGIPDEPGHGWYRYPFYPFLALSIAVTLGEYWRGNPLYRFVLYMAVGLPLLAATWGPAFGFSYVVYRGYILMSLLSFLPLVADTKQTRSVSWMSSVLMSGTVFLLTIWSILRYNEQ